ncbi:MAG: hypothetical protein L0Y66_12560 [Myxococcaceae bacterium]|nr:hypothetical protein [Myxococcaceae bacterium]MCI0671110.1 hypothetical protein [Myxococcaceae bacterium]
MSRCAKGWMPGAAAPLLMVLAACGGPPPGGTGGPGGGGPGEAVKVPVGIDGLARGEVRLEGGGFSCAKGLCLLERLEGSTVTLTAVPGAGATFTGWSGDCTGTGPCTLQVTPVSRVRASFGLPGAWSRAIGSTSGDVANAVVRDASGNVTLVGFMGADTEVDGQAITRGRFLAQFDPAGHLRWTRPLPALSDVARARVLADGALVLAGTFTGAVQFGA